MAFCRIWFVFGICCLFYSLIHQSDGAYTLATAKNLYNALTVGYNTKLRPSDEVTVYIDFTVISINYLDVKSQSFSVTGLFSVSWMDGSYVWVPGSFGDINYLFMTQTEVWRPELLVDNSVSEIAIIEDDELLMRVTFNGTVLWEPPGVYIVYCDVDVTYYPFDVQTCSISISSWSYDNSILRLTEHGSDVKFMNFEENAEWTLEESYVESGSQKDSRQAFSRGQLKFTFKLRRKTTYYIVSLLIPLTMLSFLGHLVFLLPAESGEKISFSVTVLLALTVLMTIVAGTIPSTSKNTSLLSVYLATNLIISSVEVILAVFVLRIHHRYDKDIPVSEKTQKFTRTVLARLSCLCCCNKQNENGDETPASNSRTRFPLMPLNTRISPEVLQNGVAENGFTALKDKGSQRPRSGTTSNDTDSRDLSLHVKEEREFTWLEIADMVDCICFQIFVLLTLILSIVFFVLLTSNSD